MAENFCHFNLILGWGKRARRQKLLSSLEVIEDGSKFSFCYSSDNPTRRKTSKNSSLLNEIIACKLQRRMTFLIFRKCWSICCSFHHHRHYHRQMYKMTMLEQCNIKRPLGKSAACRGNDCISDFFLGTKQSSHSNVIIYRLAHVYLGSLIIVIF